VGALFSYWLGKRIGESREFGLGLGLAFLFFPYRLFDILYRFAFAEACAMDFLPLVFYGLYRILHDEELRVMPFLSVVVGASCLILSHPLTAFVTALACLVFLLASIYRLVQAQKRNHLFLVYFGVMVVLIVMNVSFFVFPMISITSSGTFHISDPVAFWATYERMVKVTHDGAKSFSGIINYDWRNSYIGNVAGPDSALHWTLGLCLFPLSCAFIIVIDKLTLKYLGEKEWWQLLEIPAGLLLAYLPMILSRQRLEIYLALSLFALSFYTMRFLRYGLHPREHEEAEREKFSPKEYYANPDLYVTAILFLVGMLFIFVPQLWKRLPAKAYYIQFPWRLYAVVQFLFFLLVAFLLKPFRKRQWAKGAAVALACYVLCLAQMPIDKRIWSYEKGNGWYGDPTLESVLNTSRWTWNGEYIPEIYFDSSYESAYGDKSLYGTVKKYQMGAFNRTRSAPYWFVDKEHYIAPAVLEGEAEITVSYLNTPSVDFAVTASEDSLIQIPQYYFSGYRATAVFEGGKKVDCPTANVDALLAIKAPKGTYTLKVRYVGSKGQRIGYVLFFFGIAGTISFGVTSYVRRKRKEKKEKPLTA